MIHGSTRTESRAWQSSTPAAKQKTSGEAMHKKRLYFTLVAYEHATARG
jgi:hypothetical protein